MKKGRETMAKVKHFIELEYELHNKKTKVEVGNMFYNKDGEPFYVIRKLNPIEASVLMKSKYGFYGIRFYNTHNEQVVHYSNIKSGAIKNSYSGSIHGVGIIGNVDVKAYKREYTLWANMISRGYCNAEAERNPCYRCVAIHPRWLKLSNFIEDLPSLNGYEEWKSGLQYELDKDTLSPEGKKIYSKDTCMFLPKEVNSATRRKVA